MDNVDSYDTMNDQTYVAEQKNDALCLAGLISSIVSLVCCCGTVSLISLALSIIGVVRVNKNGQAGKGMGIAGIIISGVSILILILLILIVVIPMILFAGFIGSVVKTVGDGAHISVILDNDTGRVSYEIKDFDDVQDFLDDNGVTFDIKN